MESSLSLSDIVGYLGGFVGLVVSGLYAWYAYCHKTPLNPATWGTVCTLDVVGVVLVLMTKAHTDPFPVLQCAWSLAAFATTIVALKNGSRFVWGFTEYVSVAGACITAIVYVLSRLGYIIHPGFIVPDLWIECYCVSCLISVIPQAVNYVEDSWNAYEALWMWKGTGCSLIISLAGVLLGAHKGTLQSFTYTPLVVIYLFLLMLNVSMITLIFLSGHVEKSRVKLRQKILR